MKVLFNADDFGLTKGVTDGIIQSYTNGVVRATTLMMNGKAVDYAVEQANKHSGLKIGVHLVLSYGKPLRKDVPELVNEQGDFKFLSEYDVNNVPNAQQVEKEWTTQIEAFLNTGLTLNHIDSHHHVHRWEALKDVVVKLARQYDVPVRYVESIKEHKDILLTDSLWTGFYKEGVTKNIFEDIRTINVDSIEVMTHPAIVDDELREISSYTDKRTEELEILTNLEVPDWAKI